MTETQTLYDSWTQELVFALIGAAIPWLVQLARRAYVRKRQVGYLLQFSPRQPVGLIAPTVHDSHLRRTELVTFVTPFESLSVLRVSTRLLRAAGLSETNLDIRFSEEAKRPDELKKNLIVIGGPIHNWISRKTLENNKISKKIRFCGHKIEISDGNHLFSFEPSTKDGLITRDGALLLNISNPWSEEHRILFVMGCRAFGAIGAAEYLATRMKELAKQVRRIEKLSKKDPNAWYAFISFDVNHIDGKDQELSFLNSIIETSGRL